MYGYLTGRRGDLASTLIVLIVAASLGLTGQLSAAGIIGATTTSHSVVTVKGHVFDADTGTPVPGALVRIFDVVTDELLADSLFTGEDGYYEAIVAIALSSGRETNDLVRDYAIESVFPNPVHARHSGIEIRYRAPTSETAEPEVEVFDLLGRRVPANTRLASGYYGFRLRFPDGSVTGFQSFLVVGSVPLRYNAIRMSGSGDQARPPVLASGTGGIAEAGPDGHVRVEVRKPGYRPASAIAPVIDQVAEHLFELDPLETATLAIDITHGPPGTIVELTGMEAGIFDQEDLEIFFGEFPSIIMLRGDTIVTTIPLPDNDDIWTGLPDDPLQVEVRIADWVAGRTADQVTIEALVPAPGTLWEIRDKLVQFSDGLIELFREFPVRDPYETAIIMALEELFHEILVEGDSSLTRSLQDSEGDLDLIDALMATSGALEYYGSLLDFVSSANGNGPDQELASFFRLCRQGGADIDLACRMQIHVMLTNFTEYVISPTVKGFARVTSIPMGYASLRNIKVPQVKVASAILSVIEFIMTNIAPGLYPSVISSFEIITDDDCLELDEMTETNIEITAVNDSPETTVTAIIELALTIIGVVHKSPEVKTFEQIVFDLIKRALSRFNSIMGTVISHLGLEPVDGVTIVPPMTWGPVTIEESDLVRLISGNTEVLVDDEDALEWVGIDRGRTHIQAETRGPGDRSRVLINCPGCQYTGAAFGENIARTERIEIRVDEDGILDVAIIGLPDHLVGDIEVEGEEFSEHVTRNVRFEEIDPGEYTITAETVPDPEEDNEYDPEEALQTIDVEACEVVTFATVTYKPRYGQLAVDISGLPPGEAADVWVTGDGFEQNLIESETITRLEPGEYTITGWAVIAGGHVYDAVPRSMTVTITAGETTPADIEYCVTGSEAGDTVAGGTTSNSTGKACPPWAGTITVTRTLSGSSGEWDVWDTVTEASFFVRLDHVPEYSLSSQHFVTRGDGDRVTWVHADDRRRTGVPCNGATITETRTAAGGGTFDLPTGAGPSLRIDHPESGQYSIEPFLISAIGMGTGPSYEFSIMTSLCNWQFDGSGFFTLAHNERSVKPFQGTGITLSDEATFGPKPFSADLFETIKISWNLFSYED